MRLTAILRELIAAGLVGEDLFAALERIENTRSKAAIRQQRFRSKRYALRYANGSDAEGVTSNGITDQPPSKQTKKTRVTRNVSQEGHISKKESINKKDYMRASRLSDAWTLPDTDRQWARQRSMTDSEIDGQVQRFRDYWVAKPGKDGAKANWSATWRNWCRTFLERAGRSIEPVGQVTVKGVWIRQTSEQWEWWKAAKGKPFPVDRNGGWYAPTEWPSSQWPDDEPFDFMMTGHMDASQ